ncbi:MAG: hypothetical protein WAU86_13230 [Oricola sp.]
MEPITAAVMLILGCDHSMMVCRQTAEPVRHYASVQECEADRDMRLRFVDSPVARAECVGVPGLKDGEKVRIDWRLDATGGLFAEAELRGSAPVIADAKLRDSEPMAAETPMIVADAGTM